MTTPAQKQTRQFSGFPLELVRPEFASKLTDLLFSLENYRRYNLAASEHTTPHGIFLEIKDIFHMLESIGSARLEGNNTTVPEYVEAKLEQKVKGYQPQPPNHKEIENGELALAFIDANIKDADINRAFLSEIHKLVVQGLPTPPHGEGSLTPGVYRKSEVEIRNSDHVVVPSSLLETYMEELLAFVNEKAEPKFDLLKVAIAHHRFVWVHPYDNGNGRTVRLFTYAMLLKYGFGDPEARLINPVAVFKDNREEYCSALASADGGSTQGLLEWCEYMLTGLNQELEKLGRLGNYSYLTENILTPALESAYDAQIIKHVEMGILKIAVTKGEIANGDINAAMRLDTVTVSKILRTLREARMLVPMPNNLRRYRISFNNNYLLRHVVRALREKDFCLGWQ